MNNGGDEASSMPQANAANADALLVAALMGRVVLKSRNLTSTGASVKYRKTDNNEDTNEANNIDDIQNVAVGSIPIHNRNNNESITNETEPPSKSTGEQESRKKKRFYISTKTNSGIFSKPTNTNIYSNPNRANRRALKCTLNFYN